MSSQRMISIKEEDKRKRNDNERNARLGEEIGPERVRRENINGPERPQRIQPWNKGSIIKVPLLSFECPASSRRHLLSWTSSLTEPSSPRSPAAMEAA